MVAAFAGNQKIGRQSLGFKAFQRSRNADGRRRPNFGVRGRSSSIYSSSYISRHILRGVGLLKGRYTERQYEMLAVA
jgi:hypothetical protein